MNAEQKKLFDKLTDLQKGVATNILAGMKQRAAYVAAGGVSDDPGSINAIVSRMLTDANVKAFIDSMRTDAVDDAIMSKTEAMKILSQIGRGNLTDIVKFKTAEIGKDLETGQPLLQTTWFIPEELQFEDPEKLVIISELEVGKNGPKIKTHSKTAAIAQLSKMAGWDAPQKVQGIIGVADVELTDSQRAVLDRALDDEV